MKKIIIWGAKLDSGHTHGFAHLGFARAAEYLSREVYWLDNRDNTPPEFFDDSIIISEQWLVTRNGLSNNLPLRKSSHYFINYVGNKPATPDNQMNPGASHYIDKVGRLTEFRFACNWGVDGVPDKAWAYKFEKEKCEQLPNSFASFEKGKDYDVLYTLWATDLTPDEIDFENRFTPFNEPKYAFFSGTISKGWGNADDGNESFFIPFIQECEKNNIQFAYNNSQQSPVSHQQLKKWVLESFIPLDIRPKNHLANNYVPDRLIKNVSYGQLPITNSKAAYEFFDGDAAYSNDTAELFHIAKEMQEDPKTKDKILKQMKKVKEYHTFVNRLKDIIYISESL